MLIKIAKRELINLVFDKLTLDEGVLNYEIREPFRILFDLSQSVESSKVVNFEGLQENNFEPDFSRQSEGENSSETGSWLPGMDGSDNYSANTSSN